MIKSYKGTQWTSYSYLGGGVGSDPPDAFGMVSRYMPMNIAIPYAALIAFITGSDVDKACFIRRPFNNFEMEPEDMDTERTRQIETRRTEVLKCLEHMCFEYGNFTTMMERLLPA